MGAILPTPKTLKNRGFAGQMATRMLGNCCWPNGPRRRVDCQGKQKTSAERLCTFRGVGVYQGSVVELARLATGGRGEKKPGENSTPAPKPLNRVRGRRKHDHTDVLGDLRRQYRAHRPSLKKRPRVFFYLSLDLSERGTLLLLVPPQLASPPLEFYPGLA